MKIFLGIIGLTIASLVAAAAINSRDVVMLTLDSTTICVPKEYVPGLSPFGQWLQNNVSGLDNSGQSEIIRLPAKLIMKGVQGYKFSHINKYNVDHEHEISGIAHNISNVGNPHNEIPCEDEYDLGSCYQSVVYKDIYYQYSLQTVELENKDKLKEYLITLFEKWERNCAVSG